MGDWMAAPSPSPRTFFASILDDDVSSKENIDPPENKSGTFSVGSEKPFVWENGYAKDEMKADVGIDQATESNVFAEPRVGARGRLLERIAARAGFNAPRLVTDNIKHADISQDPEVHPPYLTIPPGLSPTTLLDSPVFLSNSLVQPSPTTGKFQFRSSGYNSSSTMVNSTLDKSIEHTLNSSFAFEPVGTSGTPLISTSECKVSFQMENSAVSETVKSGKGPLDQSGPSSRIQASSEMNARDHDISKESMALDMVGGSEEDSPPLHDQLEEDVDQRGCSDRSICGASPEDGYNWRKYGQKQVKGSEYPRSYYKCTHPNCPVKKKVERSHEGHITEIIYKGVHCHPKPPPNRRSALSSFNAEAHLDGPKQVGPDPEVDAIWTTMQRGTSPGTLDWRSDNLEVKSSVGTEYCNTSTSLQAHNGVRFEAGDVVEGTSTFSNDEDEDERMQGNGSLGYNGEGDESESKRRKMEAYSTEMSGAARAMREPRVVVQTTSEVDILDDGYRWRKYGQKVVKGNPNPRSYYKCTSAGCTVRKHVERASHDLKSVITTYEGKHNHDVPAPRNSSHVNSSIPNALSNQASALSNNVHRPEQSLLHSNMPIFERPPSSLTSFGLPSREQVGPSHGFSFRMNQPAMANMTMSGFGSNQGKLPVAPIHPFLGQTQSLNDMGFILSKEEPKVEPVSETNINISNGSSVYRQIMSRLPLGPQM